MDATPEKDTASEIEVGVDEVFDFVVKKARKHKKVLIIGGAVLLNVVVIKKFRSGAKEATEALISPNSVRIYQGPWGTDTYEFALLMNGPDLRKELGVVGLTTAAPVVAKK